MRLDTVDQQLINHYQRNLPVCERPYREMADTLGISEDEVISRLAVLQQQQVLSRVGPVFEHSQAGGNACARNRIRASVWPIFENPGLAPERKTGSQTPATTRATSVHPRLFGPE